MRIRSDKFQESSFQTQDVFGCRRARAIIKADYRTSEEAEQEIAAGLAAFYQAKYPDAGRQRSADIQTAGRAQGAIYSRNVFPDLKVAWGTYPNNLGHTDFPGCFRCHDDGHTTADAVKKTIAQDCSACHQALAVEETAPDVLKTLGVAQIVSKSQKQ